MVLKYRNCSIAHLPRETSAVNTMKCLLKIIHKIGVTCKKSFHAMAYPKTFSAYRYTIGLVTQIKLKTVLN